MKTDAFVTMLATGSASEMRIGPSLRLSIALGVALPVAVLMMVTLLQVNPAWRVAMFDPHFLLKVGYVVAIAAGSWALSIRLSRPAGRVMALLAALAVPAGMMAATAVGVLLLAEDGSRANLVLGDTWKVCAALIAMLSTPVLVATLLAMRELAPTRFASAGAAAGLFSGAVGALVYCVHCPELAPPFVVVWYSAGMAIPTAIGALLGPRILRW